MEPENTAGNIYSFFDLIKWMESQPGIKYPSVKLEAVEHGILARATWIAIGGERHGKQCTIAHAIPRDHDSLRSQYVESYAARNIAQALIQSWPRLEC